MTQHARSEPAGTGTASAPRSAELDDFRFDSALYTTAEAADIVNVPASTLRGWAKPRGAWRPMVTSLPAGHRREPTIPFVGAVEALVLAAFRSTGKPLPRIRPALEELKTRTGTGHPLASRRLRTDGARILLDYARRCGGRSASSRALEELVRSHNGRAVFAEPVNEHLHLISYDDDGYASLIRLPAYKHATVVADPHRSFGQPIFAQGACRVNIVLELFWAGGPHGTLRHVSDEFRAPVSHIEDVLRVTSRRIIGTQEKWADREQGLLNRFWAGETLSGAAEQMGVTVHDAEDVLRAASNI